MNNGGVSTYQEAQILGSTPGQLVTLLYDHLLLSLKRGKRQIEERDIEGKSQSLGKASDILFQLLGSLDFERGGDIAARLSGLYAYFANEIGEASRTLEAARLEPLIEMVETLRGAWREAAASTTTSQGAPAPGGGRLNA